MSADTLILEVRAALADIVSQLDRRPPERAALAEISGALADVVALMDKPWDNSAIVAAISRLKLAPVVHVSAPQVTVQGPTATGWVFEVNYAKGGNISRITATPLQ